MDKATKDFTEGKKEKNDILATFVNAMYEVDVTCSRAGRSTCSCRRMPRAWPIAPAQPAALALPTGGPTLSSIFPKGK